MNPSSDQSDEFLREQLRQLRAKGHAPEEAADILLQAQKAILGACQKLLDELPAENDADVGGQVHL